MMTNQKQEGPISRRPIEVDEDWFIRIQRTKTAREQAERLVKQATRQSPLRDAAVAES